ncbi:MULTISPECIES: sodium:alanine symporter family protein [unclassified Leeuwenhoekiella]|uniref:alanine/glycine:cation symporter family protein n=1 Tax=unclassified Leeuwenhoekiella TaxID=2615029 RepID=UPI000C48C72E|nr:MULTISPECIES: alanine/glycine:cation symporter family protein [unclassified Leeuwenhoekiella]MAW94596.1 sodium/alanine symporter [Leeuwenhoekiella sp.]MBA82019.1 sodium/alanine symporter [Leeuwenhoekiella sp.]|tara:strand:+ start:1598 stop:2965 length:1368 start_codon:yes stop_codon:yes gene_type:complete
MEKLNVFFEKASGFVWGLPLLVLLIGGGLLLMIYSRFVPFKYFVHAIQVLRGKYDNPEDAGEITHFQALMTALSSTVGMGNIAGVAVAIAAGGPGAVFWMWVSGVVGMSTKFFTCSLSILYRGKDDRGQIQGGPMYFIVEGLGKSWKFLAVFFSLAGLIGALPVFNVNQLTQAINDILLVPNGIEKGFSSDLIIGVILAVITAVVVLGGLDRISKTASKLVPAMVGLYFIAVIIILFVNLESVPYYFKLIFTDAFTAENYRGDPIFGGVLGALIVLGIRRGAFSNEAGIGTAPMAHGATRTNEPIREGLVAMMGPFIDTLIVCTLTAMCILVTGVWQTSDANGVSLTAKAFGDAMPGFGTYILLICIAIFSISSLFSYSYYGTKCLSFLIGTKYSHLYNYFYIASILLGATTSLSLMINVIDTFFALMAIPTMLATLILAPKVMQRARAYFKAFK